MELIPLEEQKYFNKKIPLDIVKYLKGNELRLYITLCQYYNEEHNYTSLTYQEIREYFGDGWDNKNIRKYITGLEGKGFIKVDKNKNKVGYDNNIYKIFVPDEIK